MKTRLPLLDHNPWSPSKADMAARCGLAFKYRYIDKVSGHPKGAPAKIGVVLHRAQELIFDGCNAREAIAQALIDVNEELTHADLEKVRTFAKALVSFKEKVDKFTERYPAKEIFLERKWAVKPDFTPCDFFDNEGMIRGIVDMGILLENGYLVIIDHKSGRLRPMSYYGTQLDVYSVMAHAYFPEVKGIQCALNFMASERIEWGSLKPQKFIVEVLRPWLVKYLNDRAESVAAFPAKLGSHCRWCDYRDICPERVNNGNGENSK